MLKQNIFAETNGAASPVVLLFWTQDRKWRKARCDVHCAFLTRLDLTWVLTDRPTLGRLRCNIYFCSRIGTLSLSPLHVGQFVNLSEQALTLMRLTFRTQNFKAWYIGNAPSLGLAPWITVDCSCITSAREPFCELSSVEITDFFTDLAFLLKTPGEHLTVFRLFARVSERKNMILGTPCQCGLSVETNLDLRNSKLGNFKLTQFKQATTTTTKK